MLEHAQILKRIRYDPHTGIFWRLIFSQNGLSERRADVVRTKKDYRIINIGNRRYLAHRVAWLCVKKEWPKSNIDHIDGNGLNNKWQNLRACNQKQNSGNSRRPKTNKSGIKGVFWSKQKKKWCAQIKNGKSTHLGYYDNLEDAAAAYWREAQIVFGEFARNA